MRFSFRLALMVAVTATASSALLALPSAPAQAAVTGLFKVDCTYVKSAPDDPILYPGLAGASHQHDFFGNTSIGADSTLASMTGVTSTCAKNDRSSYWAPALYQNGTVVKPSSFIVYYENRAAAGRTIEPFPPGFKLIFGNPQATTAAQMDEAHLQWGCSDNSQIAAGLPPASCSTGIIQVRTMFPSCWDGQTDDTGNATGHVKFGTCPATSIQLPTIRINLYYKVGTTTGDITLASGSPYSAHEDFFNAWDQATLEGLVDDCLNALVDCGHFTGTSPGTAPPATNASSGSGSAADSGSATSVKAAGSLTSASAVGAATPSARASGSASPAPTASSSEGGRGGSHGASALPRPAPSATELRAGLTSGGTGPMSSRLVWAAILLIVAGAAPGIWLARRTLRAHA